jgi:hypothetical protein
MISCLVHSSTLKMQAICFSETLGSDRTTRCYNLCSHALRTSNSTCLSFTPACIYFEHFN